MNKNVIDAMYRNNLMFAEMLVASGQLPEGTSPEEYAKTETENWRKRMEVLSQRETNELVYDLSTGKCLGKRSDVDRRFS